MCCGHCAVILSACCWDCGTGLDLVREVEKRAAGRGSVLILAVTVLDRRPGPKMTYELIPFWSYGVKSLRMEILLNIILFIPVGLLSPRWKTVGLAAGYSMLIELAQLISCRGLFEFDDVIHNALGTALGVLIVLGIRHLLKRRQKRRSDMISAKQTKGELRINAK